MLVYQSVPSRELPSTETNIFAPETWDGWFRWSFPFGFWPIFQGGVSLRSLHGSNPQTVSPVKKLTLVNLIKVVVIRDKCQKTRNKPKNSPQIEVVAMGDLCVNVYIYKHVCDNVDLETKKDTKRYRLHISERSQKNHSDGHEDLSQPPRRWQRRVWPDQVWLVEGSEIRCPYCWWFRNPARKPGWGWENLPIFHKVS